MTTAKVGGEPEPIEAEFEPLEGAEVRPPRGTPKPRRSRTVTFGHLIAASVLAASLGAIVSIAASNAGSGAPTGTLAREIDLLRRDIADLRTRAERGAGDVVGLRSSVSAQGDRLDRLDGGATQLRTDIAALSAQISAISGAGGGESPAGAMPASSPLGILLARINRLEGIVAEDRHAPETTREVQRAIADLSLEVASLDRANTTLVSAFDQRLASLVALEDGLRTLATDVAAMRAGEAPRARGVVAAPLPAAAAVPVPAMAAADRSRSIRALASLESAARGDRPFAAEHAALAAFLPGDTGLAAMQAASKTGVPTMDQLRADFDSAANRARKIAERESDDGWNWLRDSFAGVIEFAPSALVARNTETLRTARRQLDIGDVQGAIAAVSSLSGDARGAYDIWRKRAGERARLDATLSDLNSRLLGAAAMNNSSG
ncbi:MAG: hypothetical protein IT557_16110 [Alphaproteobacteria bacterium]|nr:hypothetical protein [Alphaproteobacteria bacterium]